jgi:DNA polymerase I-like protein with 3'-5' exonuclease and polymerase domains
MDVNYKLAKSVKDIEDYIEEFPQEHPYFGLDTETTGLDTNIAGLVGISISTKEGTGLYIPIGHTDTVNLPVHECWNIISKLKNPVFFNAKFDLNVLETALGFLLEGTFEDVLEIAYIDDSNQKQKGLKYLSLVKLGFEMDELDSLFTEQEIKANLKNISTKTGEACVNYACADADATLRLRNYYQPVYEEYKSVIELDYRVTNVVRRMESVGGLEIDEDFVTKTYDTLIRIKTELQDNVFRISGRSFNIGSPQQLATILFEELKIPSQGKTKTGKYKTGEEVLKELSGTYPIVEYVLSYRKVARSISSDFEKFRFLIKTEKPVRFAFNTVSVPTFRFSAPGGDPNEDGFSGLPIQAMSKGEERSFPAVDLSRKVDKETEKAYLEDSELEEDWDIDWDELSETCSSGEISLENGKSLNRGELSETNPFSEISPEKVEPLNMEEIIKLPHVVPYKNGRFVCIRNVCSGCPAVCKDLGIDTTRRILEGLPIIPSCRKAFKAPKGYKIVSLDYKSQELVILTNFCKDPLYVEAFNQGDDVHLNAAAYAFSLEKEDLAKMKVEDPEKYSRVRSAGKTLNFSILYGASSAKISENLGVNLKRAEEIITKFNSSFSTLSDWLGRCKSFTRTNGYTTTYFGRKRWLQQEYGDPSFLDRSSVNTKIQGTAAEVTRIALVKVDKKLKENDIFSNECRLVMQIHDELSYIIREESIDKVIPIIKEAMEFKVKGWVVQLTVDCKIGDSWGLQEDYTFSDM